MVRSLGDNTRDSDSGSVSLGSVMTESGASIPNYTDTYNFGQIARSTATGDKLIRVPFLFKAVGTTPFGPGRVGSLANYYTQAISFLNDIPDWYNNSQAGIDYDITTDTYYWFAYGRGISKIAMTSGWSYVGPQGGTIGPEELVAWVVVRIKALGYYHMVIYEATTPGNWFDSTLLGYPPPALGSDAFLKDLITLEPGQEYTFPFPSGMPIGLPANVNQWRGWGRRYGQINPYTVFV